MIENFAFIDIHTHHQSNYLGVFSIENVSDNFDKLDTHKMYSAGIHPWYIDATPSNVQFSTLQSVACKHNILAIGECGLDTLSNIDLKLQVPLFIQQIHLAESLGKPLIIHCVRSYNLVLQLLNTNKVSIPVIFHGFNKDIVLANRIIDEGHYLSFGKSLFNSRVSSLFSHIPFDRFFLETDDASLSIRDIYARAASIREIDLLSLQIGIVSNFNTVFKLY